MKSNMLYKRIKDAAKLSKKYWYLYPIFAVVDVIFIVLFSKVFLKYYIEIMGILNDISSEITGKLGETKDLMAANYFNTYGVEIKMAQAVQEVTILVLVMVVTLFLIWLVFQGFNSSLLRYFSKKDSFLRVWAIFCIQSLLSWIVLIGAVYCYIKFSLFNQMTLMSAISQKLISTIFMIVLVIIFYFIFIWLNNLTLKDYIRRNFKDPFVKILKIGPVILLSIAVMITLMIGLVLLTRWNFTISLVYGVFVFLPGFTYLRILLVND